MNNNEIRINFIVGICWMNGEIVGICIDVGKWEIGQSWLEVG